MFYHTLFMQGKLEESWQMWQKVLKEAETEIEKRSAELHLYQIKTEIDKKRVEAALKRFRSRYGFFPDRTGELVQYGFLREIPRDMKGNPYQYDSKTGTINPQEGYMWKK